MSLYVFLHFKNENNGNARDFCVLILYPVTWLYCIDWLALVISEGIFRLFYVKDHVICNEGFTSPFPIWIPFISISYLIAVARTSKTTLNGSAGDGMEKREPSYTVCGIANWNSHYREEGGDSLKNGV